MEMNANQTLHPVSGKAPINSCLIFENRLEQHMKYQLYYLATPFISETNYLCKDGTKVRLTDHAQMNRFISNLDELHQQGITVEGAFFPILNPADAQKIVVNLAALIADGNIEHPCTPRNILTYNQKIKYFDAIVYSNDKWTSAGLERLHQAVLAFKD